MPTISNGRRASITVEGPPALLGSDAVSWAVSRLEAAVRQLGLSVGAGPADGADLAVTLRPATAADDLRTSESYRFTVEQDGAGRRATIAATDERGFGYALTELAERLAANGLRGIAASSGEVHAPATPVRGVTRSFSSVQHDLSWFRDRSFWPPYLDHLATQRFNRFHLALGMQYNYGAGAMGPQKATDNYLCFAYPFLVEVPGYDVRVQGVDDQERERNLAALRFIAREARRRGMGFQLGLWNHAYDYGNGSAHWYPILGIGPDIHAAYSAAAVAHLLELVPDISGVTLRVHYEGGIADGQAAFWEQMLQAMSDVGRPLDVELHAKGVDDQILDAVDKPNLRATLSAKYAAEHQGLPYHQASIRSLEAPMPVPEGYEWMGTAGFSRRFTRYGYADFLSEDRSVDVAFRVWPGTQRLLLWGDPVFAAAYARSSTFAGARGIEISEPLYFKGRKGTGEVDGRDPYVDDELRLGHADWQKYRYTYLLWGRLLYDPDTEPEVWRRHLRSEYGPAAGAIETAVAALSRVLPLTTTAHVPSASNNTYWPEIYTDLPISAWIHAPHYAFDTPIPTNWGTASPLDATMFYGVDEYAEDAVSGVLTGRYTPLEVAAWLDKLGADGQAAIEASENLLDLTDPQARRTLVDLRVLACLAGFFAGKFRAAVEYAFYRRSGDRELLARAIDLVERAHAAYGSITEIVAGVYQRDLAFGERATERGHWSDRLPAMADDLRALRLELERAPAGPASAEAELIRRSSRWRLEGGRLEGPHRFTRREPFEVRLSASDASAISGAALHYRRVDQSETFRQVEMDRVDEHLSGAVPAACTDTTYPIMYFVEIRHERDHPIFHPGFDETLANQPYVVVHSDQYELD